MMEQIGGGMVLIGKRSESRDSMVEPSGNHSCLTHFPLDGSR